MYASIVCMCEYMNYMSACITYVYTDVCMYVCMYVQYALSFINCKLSPQRFTPYHDYWDGCKIA